MQVAIEIKYIAVSECCWILMRMGFGCLTWGHCGVSPLLLLRFTHVWLWVVFNRVFVYVRLLRSLFRQFAASPSPLLAVPNVTVNGHCTNFMLFTEAL